MGILDYFNQPNPAAIEAENTTNAWKRLKRQLARDEGDARDQALRDKFGELKDRGYSPAALGTVQLAADGEIAPDMDFDHQEPSALERWQSQIDGMVTSGDPALQKKGLDMIASFQSRATSPEAATDTRTGNIKDYTFAVKDGYEGSFDDWVARGKPRQYAPKYVTPAEAKSLRWENKENEEPIVGQNWEDIRGRVRTLDDGAEMRSNATRVVDTLENALFNPDTGIYLDPFWQKTGASGVLSSMALSAVKDLAQRDNYKAYSDVRAGSAAQIVRAMGEKGALSDKDIERALALLPNISGIRGGTDLPATARQKFKFLRLMLNIDPSQWGPILDAAEADIASSSEVVDDNGDVWE